VADPSHGFSIFQHAELPYPLPEKPRGFGGYEGKGGITIAVPAAGVASLSCVPSTALRQGAVAVVDSNSWDQPAAAIPQDPGWSKAQSMV
jgi:hypothetical protein